MGAGGHAQRQEGGESRVGGEQWSADFGVKQREGEGVGAQAANGRDVRAVAPRSQAYGALNLVQTKWRTNLQHRSSPKMVAAIWSVDCSEFHGYVLHVVGLAREQIGRRRTFPPETSHAN